MSERTIDSLVFVLVCSVLAVSVSASCGCTEAEAESAVAVVEPATEVAGGPVRLDGQLGDVGPFAVRGQASSLVLDTEYEGTARIELPLPGGERVMLGIAFFNAGQVGGQACSGKVDASDDGAAAWACSAEAEAAGWTWDQHAIGGRYDYADGMLYVRAEFDDGSIVVGQSPVPEGGVEALGFGGCE